MKLLMKMVVWLYSHLLIKKYDNFRIGNGVVINQQDGSISGGAYTKKFVCKHYPIYSRIGRRRLKDYWALTIIRQSRVWLEPVQWVSTLAAHWL